MSSHWEWAEKIIAKHDAETPFAPENGEPLQFAVGDRVIYTNVAGAQFRFRITGFYERTPGDTLYATGARYLVDSESPWMPVKEASLRLDEARNNPEWGSW